MTDVLMVVNKHDHITTGLEDRQDLEYTFSTPDCSPILIVPWVKSYDPDIIHFQYIQNIITGREAWWSQLILSIIFIFNLLLLKMSRYKIVWTAHHASAHETQCHYADAAARWALLRIADEVIVLDEKMCEVIDHIAPNTLDPTVIPLGDYSDLYEYNKNYESDISDTLKSPVVGVFGYLRKYKRVPLGIESFDQSQGAGSLLIAGNPDSDVIQGDIQKAINNANGTIVTKFEFIPDSELRTYLDMIDILLILNDQESVPASMHLAASHEIPVVTTIGGVSESMARKYDLGPIVEPYPQSIAKGIDDLLHGEHNPRYNAYSHDHSWKKYADSHAQLYSKLS
jgi:hypothetical protein